jgi:hypothetical protein
MYPDYSTDKESCETEEIEHGYLLWTSKCEVLMGGWGTISSYWFVYVIIFGIRIDYGGYMRCCSEFAKKSKVELVQIHSVI